MDGYRLRGRSLATTGCCWEFSDFGWLYGYSLMIDELEVEVGPLARWQVHWCDPRREVSWYATNPVLAGLPTLAEWAHAHGTQPGQPVLLRSDGWSVPEVNGFFASARMRNASAGTRRKYAFAVAVWLGFLDATSRAWHDADEEDIAGFKFWRMTDEANVRRVAGGTVLDDLVAISAFYRWAGFRFGVSDPVARRQVPGPAPGTSTESFAAGPHVVRGKDVKWLDPAGYARWVDVGLRGLDLSGREIDGWRGRNSQRDCAFVDGLYGTGLRLSEWASVLRLELPADDEARTYYTCRLAAACAKGGRGRRFWKPRSVLTDVLAYEEGNAPRRSAAPSVPAATSSSRGCCWSSACRGTGGWRCATPTATSWSRRWTRWTPAPANGCSAGPPPDWNHWRFG